MKPLLSIIILVFFVTFVKQSFSQIEFSIDSISIESIYVKSKPGVKPGFRTDLLGPTVNFYLSIKNSEEYLELNYDSLTFGYVYFYDGVLYNKPLCNSLLPPFKRVILLNNESMSFTFFYSYLIDLDLQKYNFNYYKMIKRILPTLRCYVIMKNEIYYTDKIKKVIIKKGYEDENLIDKDMSKKTFKF